MLASVVAVITGAGAVALGGASLLARRVLFPEVDAPPDPRPPGVESWWLETDEGPVEAWFIPGQGATASRPGPLVVFAHGNGETVDLWPSGVWPYTARGFSVLLPEYRGYGRSRGRPTQAVIVDDAMRHLQRALARPEVDPGRLLFHGYSLGGGVVGQLARLHRPRALVLESTFVSVRALARRYGVPGFIVRDPFETVAVVAELDVPVLVLHGEDDPIVPFWNGQGLAAAAPSGELVAFPGAGHAIPHTSAAYWGPILSLVERAGLLTPLDSNP